MVFLAGWDARYYWDYPRFDVDPRMGGEAAFKRLISEGQQMGYRFLLMFGSKVANPAAPGLAKIANAQVRNVYGQLVPGNYVDWDGDRKGDSSMVLMKLAVASWREHFRGPIAAMIDKYGVDAYFLDICGFWENNPDGDMFGGTAKLVKALAARYPGIPAVAEMQYDALMGIIPMSHAARYPLYPQGTTITSPASPISATRLPGAVRPGCTRLASGPTGRSRWHSARSPRLRFRTTPSTSGATWWKPILPSPASGWRSAAA